MAKTIKKTPYRLRFISQEASSVHRGSLLTHFQAWLCCIRHKPFLLLTDVLTALQLHSHAVAKKQLFSLIVNEAPALLSKKKHADFGSQRGWNQLGFHAATVCITAASADHVLKWSDVNMDTVKYTTWRHTMVMLTDTQLLHNSVGFCCSAGFGVNAAHW